jgi:hypothetical protein
MTQTKKGKEINIFKSLARSNVFSTKSEEQEINLVWPNLCIFWLLFICLYRSNLNNTAPSIGTIAGNVNVATSGNVILRLDFSGYYFKWTKCFISFIFTTERVFYNSHIYSLYVGSLLQLISITQCNFRVKTSQPMKKIEIKITNLRFASLFVEICRMLLQKFLNRAEYLYKDLQHQNWWVQNLDLCIHNYIYIYIFIYLFIYLNFNHTMQFSG